MFRKILHKYRQSSWLLGFVPNGLDGLLASEVQWISNGKYTNKWFADPFIMDMNDSSIIILAEEFDYNIQRGRIAKLLVNRKTMTIEDCRILLDLDTHLSFPFIWKVDDEIYVAPENYQSGTWNLYRYNKQTDLLDFVVKLVESPLTDATIFNTKDSNYILSTFEPRPNGSSLFVWELDYMNFPKVISRPLTSIEFNENVARNADGIFLYNNKLIRPAQESNHTYGHALVFQVIDIEKGKIECKEMCRLLSPHPSYREGMHTFNAYNEAAVVDV